jgi:hypothetical protein
MFIRSDWKSVKATAKMISYEDTDGSVLQHNIEADPTASRSDMEVRLMKFGGNNEAGHLTVSLIDKTGAVVKSKTFKLNELFSASQLDQNNYQYRKVAVLTQSSDADSTDGGFGSQGELLFSVGSGDFANGSIVVELSGYLAGQCSIGAGTTTQISNGVRTCHDLVTGAGAVKYILPFMAE